MTANKLDVFSRAKGPSSAKCLKMCLNPVTLMGLKHLFKVRHVMKCFAESEPQYAITKEEWG